MLKSGIFELSLKPRVADSRDPRVSWAHRSVRSKQSRRRRASPRDHSSSTANPPAVTSSLHDLRDLAKLLSYLAGLVIDSRADGGDHGGTAGLDVGGTPATTSAAQPKVRTSNYECWGT